MCRTVNLIHRKKSESDLNNDGISKAMTARGTAVSGDMVQKYFSGSSGVPVDNLGAFLHALGLKVVDENSPDISPEEYTALKLFAGKHLNEK